MHDTHTQRERESEREREGEEGELSFTAENLSGARSPVDFVYDNNMGS